MAEGDALENYLAARSAAEENQEPKPEKKPTPEPVEEKRPRRPRRERGIVLACIGLLVGGAAGYAVTAYCTADESVEQLKLALRNERKKVDVLVAEKAYLQATLDYNAKNGIASGQPAMPEPPPITPMDIQSVSDSDAKEWRDRYRYAALQYNKVVADYNRLRKEYLKVMGKAGSRGGKLVTGAQFYQVLQKDTKAEIDRLDNKYRQGGLRHAELRELEQERDAMRQRKIWLKNMADKYRVGE